MLLIDQNALVTGGSLGIGAATCLELAREGANVCFTYRRHADQAAEICDKIKATGLKALAIKCDVSAFDQVAQAVKNALNFLGQIDILVNNAGMNWDGVSWKMTEEQWDRVISVNLKGYFNFTRQVAPLFKAQQSGKIINVTSINGLRGKFGQSNYCASKAGIIGLTKALAKELGAFGVNVNAVAPGLIETDMLKESEFRDRISQMALDEAALKRLGQPEAPAGLIAFLASKKAEHITGEVIKIDGGQYI